MERARAHSLVDPHLNSLLSQVVICAEAPGQWSERGFEDMVMELSGEQCLLKLLNFLLTLVAAAIVLYSLWMLNQWHKHHGDDAPTPSPADDLTVIDNLVATARSAMEALNLPTDSAVSEGRPVESLTFLMDSPRKLGNSFFPDHLPAPWFIYALLGVGIVSCLITCTGHIAAETSSACCLSCYTLLIGMFLIVQAAVTATIFFDENWRKDIPYDPTGQLDNITAFIQDNYDICKWFGLGIIIVEALALLISLSFRALLDPRKSGYESDDDYPPRSARAPLLNRQATSAGNPPAAGGTPENRPVRSSVAKDEWSKRMREKYGLDTSEFTYNPSESRRFQQPGLLEEGALSMLEVTCNTEIMQVVEERLPCDMQDAFWRMCIGTVRVGKLDEFSVLLWINF
ncbi:hypothetical protein R1flu_015815 [Riccia fluitans]|uniref:Tetraspanin-18 n=1 Tax=Riccia fluitans TaxID=41844 RepID=A0ABD1YK21_9MARC